MPFSHTPGIWQTFPELAAVVALPPKAGTATAP